MVNMCVQYERSTKILGITASFTRKTNLNFHKFYIGKCVRSKMNLIGSGKNKNFEHT